MPFILFMGLMGLMYMGASTFAETSAQKTREDTTSAASAMTTYHSFAARQCTSPFTCPAGPIVVVAPVGSTVNVASMVGKFLSYTDGTVIVTTITDAYSRKLGVQTGLLNNALSISTYGSVLAGPYVPSETVVLSDMTHKLVRLPDGSHVMESGMLSSRLRSIPPTIGGLSLVAGQPIIVTPIF